jgi:hypothetical protein
MKMTKQKTVKTTPYLNDKAGQQTLFGKKNYYQRIRDTFFDVIGRKLQLNRRNGA